MRNIKLTIEYDGTDFAGWQLQPGERTVQGVIEKALNKTLGEKMRVIASGRTDSGVHAKAQAANFKTNSNLSYDSIKKALNAKLPPDVAIKDCRRASEDFNARFDAKLKTYRYTISNSPVRPAIARRYAYFMPQPLNVCLMRKEADALIGRKDFKSFHASGRSVKDFRRHIKSILIKKDRDNFIYVDIEADGFLYNMARNIVGTLVEVARGKLPAGSTTKILKARDRRGAGPTMPAKGLCLLEVKY